MKERGKHTLTLPTVASNDLNTPADLTSPNLLASEPPMPPNSEDVFSVTPDKASEVF